MRTRTSRLIRCAQPLLMLALLLVASYRMSGQSLDLDRGRAQDMLKVVAADIEKNFYDPTLKGLDWKGLVAQARERIKRANSPGETFTAIFALVDRLQDSHTLFIPPQRSSRILFGFDAKPFGDEIRIYKLKDDGAAKKAGLRLGDRIVAVNGFAAERRSFDRMMVYFRALRPVRVLELVYTRGSEPVRTLQLEGQFKEGEILKDLTTSMGWNEFVREVVARQSEEEKVRSEKYEDGISYLRVPSFVVDQSSLDHQVGKHADSRALILDLRNNPGGSRDLLTSFAGFFEAQPTVMVETREREKTEPLKVKPRHPTLKMPLFVLVDSGTASAGEMFARHFQRTGRAVVVGDTTSGRVNVAKIFPHHHGVDVVVPYAVEVAVGRVVFAGGEELEGRGVVPDQRCVPSEDDLREERDPCLDLAKSLARKALGLPAGAREK
jgi:C-terminal processing protease CtpA/Prc